MTSLPEKNSMELNEAEANLIKLIRHKYRYGEIIIIIHDGSPKKIKKIDVFDDLKGSLYKTNPQYDWNFLNKLNK